jgi:hypothetical protein
MLKLLVGSLDDEKIEEIGQQISSRHIQEFIMLWYKKISLDTLMH